MDTTELLTALVIAPDGVRFVAVADCAGRLTSKLAEYVLTRCDDALWPPVALEVRELVESGRPWAAILLYFEHVGNRWDEERLAVSVVDRSTMATRPQERRDLLPQRLP